MENKLFIHDMQPFQSAEPDLIRGPGTPLQHGTSDWMRPTSTIQSLPTAPQQQVQTSDREGADGACFCLQSYTRIVVMKRGK